MTELRNDIPATPAQKVSFIKSHKNLVVNVACVIAGAVAVVVLKGRMDDHIAEVAENSHSTTV